MSTKTMTNKYAGACTRCGQEVPAGGGIARKHGGGRYGPPARWTVEHRPKVWVGSPVSGRWVGGCYEQEGDDK